MATPTTLPIYKARWLHRPPTPRYGSSDEHWRIFEAESDEYTRQRSTFTVARYIATQAEHRYRFRTFQTVTAPKIDAEVQSRSFRKRRHVARWTTSLDHVETILPAQRPDTYVRLSVQRQRTAENLLTTSESALQTAYADAVRGCGGTVWVALTDDGPTTIRERCHRRACVYCECVRGAQITKAGEQLMEMFERPKFLTLTVKPRGMTLRAQIQRVNKEFAALRRTAFWKSAVRAGMYVIEIKRHPERLHWHVHIHAIIDARFLDQQTLSETWHKITKDSSIVHITRANSAHAKYVGKYVGKGSNPACEAWEQWAYLNEIRGLRLAATFGEAPSLKSLKPPPTHTLIAPLEVVQKWADSGDENARAMLNVIAARLLETEGGPRYETPPTKARPPTLKKR